MTEAASSKESLEFEVLAAQCPSRTVLDHLMSKWGTLIMLVLKVEPQRFSEIRRQVGGINEKALSGSLRALERDGFVDRKASDGYPSRVEYKLTPLGAGTAKHILDLVDHLEGSMLQILDSREEYDEKTQ